MDISRLQKAIDHGQGEFLLEDIIQLIEEGKMQLLQLPETETLVVTEIVKYPRKTRLRVVLVEGVLDTEAIKFMETYAQALGLDGLEGWGRKGWERALKGLGYTTAYTVIVKDF